MCNRAQAPTPPRKPDGVATKWFVFFQYGDAARDVGKEMQREKRARPGERRDPGEIKTNQENHTKGHGQVRRRRTQDLT